MQFRTDMKVELDDWLGEDKTFVRMAKVSTLNDQESSKDFDMKRFLNFLLKNKHMSPFEHGVMTFRLEVPIFVAREFMRHRIASYNEMSGRYTEMRPEFYVPDVNIRPLAQVGRPGAYEYTTDQNEDLGKFAENSITRAAVVAWRSYETMLENGVAKEVARIALPLNIYTQFYVSMNPRGLMNFLSLRTEYQEGVSATPSYPQWEIARVAEEMETCFQRHFPVTHAVWHENGRQGA